MTRKICLIGMKTGKEREEDDRVRRVFKMNECGCDC